MIAPDKSWLIEAIEEAALKRARETDAFMRGREPVSICGLTQAQAIWLISWYQSTTGRDPATIDPQAPLLRRMDV